MGYDYPRAWWKEAFMQRNMDLVRMILLRLESSPSGWAPDDFGIKSFSPEEIGYHAHIMMQDGLIEGQDVTNFEGAGPEALPTSLTWRGHEFLDLARDQERWNQAKAIVAKVGSAPISVWTKVLTDLMWKNVDTAASKSN
jgi:Hypothetical protein (DUF2513)